VTPGEILYMDMMFSSSSIWFVVVHETMHVQSELLQTPFESPVAKRYKLLICLRSIMLQVGVLELATKLYE
jgi:hypothetical protein